MKERFFFAVSKFKSFNGFSDEKISKILSESGQRCGSTYISKLRSPASNKSPSIALVVAMERLADQSKYPDSATKGQHEALLEEVPTYEVSHMLRPKMNLESGGATLSVSTVIPPGGCIATLTAEEMRIVQRHRDEVTAKLKPSHAPSMTAEELVSERAMKVTGKPIPPTSSP